MDRRAVKQADWIRDHLGEETFKICAIYRMREIQHRRLWMKENEQEFMRIRMVFQANVMWSLN